MENISKEDWQRVVDLSSQYDKPLNIYIRSWVNALAYGDFGAQEASLFALRSWGIEVWGQGYGDEFVWRIGEGPDYIIVRPDKR